MPSNSFCNRWQNEGSTYKLLHDRNEPSTDDKKIRGTRQIRINWKTYKFKINRQGEYSFSKTSDDKLLEVKTPKERKQEIRDSLDSCCQTPIDWKELTKYDINNLLQDTSTEKSKKTTGTRIHNEENIKKKYKD